MPASAADLRLLLDRLKAEQHRLIEGAADEGGLPHKATLQGISVLETRSPRLRR